MAAPVTSAVLSPRPQGADAERRGAVALAAFGLTLAVVAVYANTLAAPFVFDDVPGIVDNESIRDLSALATVLSPPPEAAGAAGRPVVNLSLALNYAFGGTAVRGYHAVNLLLHAAATLTLFGLVRRTLHLLRPAAPALPAAFAAALLWAVHPLQTESVTCVIQRSELLGGLFYLLTLYCFARAAATDSPRGWPLLCVGACVLGMASKEFVASVPLAAALYDRTFVAGSFAEAWRRRGRLYLALSATWLVLAFLMLRSAERGGTVGFGLGMSAWDYALTQCRALMLYFKLSVWPHPLVMDYGFETVIQLGDVLPQALLLLALVVATIIACRRRSPLGFAVAVALAVLAPSSSFVPLVTQTIAEHRMYLPLAGVLVPLALGAAALGPRLGLALVVGLAVAFGGLTLRRNRDYRSLEAIWTDTLAKWPTNPRAYIHLGLVFAADGRIGRAEAAYRAALRLRRDFVPGHLNLGDLLSEFGRLDEAMVHLETAVKLHPLSAQAHLNLGTNLDRLDRPAEAIAEYRRAVELNPRLAQAHSNLGDALQRAGQLPEAMAHLETALRLKPDHAAAAYLLACAHARAGRLAEARAQFAAAQRLKPGDATGLHNWANTLAAAGLPAEAATHFEAALRLRPDFPEAHYNYGNALAGTGQFAAAASHYEAALRLRPDYAAAENNLANALTSLDRPVDAVPHYERSLRLRPANATAHHNLGLALARTGRLREAADHFAAAVRLAPDFQAARDHLAAAQAQLLSAPPRD